MAMNFRRRVAWALKALQAAGSMLFSGNGGQGGRGWRRLVPGSSYDYEAEAGDLWRNSAVAACLRVIRTNFPEPKLEVCRAVDGNPNEEPEILDHDLVKLIDTPNAHYSHFELWAAVGLSLVIDGNGFVLKVRSLAGKVVQLWWVPHWTMEPRWPADGSVFISHYAYTINGRTFLIPVSEVIHFRTGLDPHNTRMGLSDLKAGVREVCSDNEAAGFAATTLRNCGVPAVVITPAEEGGTFGEGQQDDITAQWRAKLTGEGRGDPLVTDAVKVQKLGMTPKELSLGDLPDRFEDRICALIGVNPQVAGLTSGHAHKTYNNYAEARRAFYEDTLIPLQKMVARTLTLQLLVDFLAPPDAYVRWQYRGVQCLRENENDLVTRTGISYQVHRLLTLNEARKAIGQSPVAGGDKFADGSTPQEGPQQATAPVALPAPAKLEADPEVEAETKALLAIARKALESRS